MATLRRLSLETWRTHDPDGVDVAAIEHMDRRSLEMLAEDGEDRRHGISVPPGSALALLVQIELPSSLDPEAAYDQIASLTRDLAPRTALQRFCRVLDDAGAFDATELAMPGDRRRAEQFLAFRRDYPEVDVELSAVPLHPVRLLTDASDHAAMVVVGSRGRGAFTGLLLGSVSQGVLHRARCTVVIAR